MPKADILIVDDTPTNLSLLSQMLNEQGYLVRAVTSGERALESAFTRPPDLILLDIRMQGINGFETCQALKADERTSQIPVIFISALYEIQDKVHGFQSGGIDYVTKPFQVEEVLARIENHLKMQNLQRQLEKANLKMAHELSIAGQMQANFLPARLPNPPGWLLSAQLKPARETCGDFYNAFYLPNGNLAVLIADVVDKGVAAALFMAYCWSILRTYAEEHPTQPDEVFAQVNRRILEDITQDQFVTVFLGILDANLGELTYCNAGHPPPLLVDMSNEVKKLERTGMALGITGDFLWKCEKTRLLPGSRLLLYTDGVLDATNPVYENFGEARLIEALVGGKGHSPAHNLKDILSLMQTFVDGADPADDIAMLLIQRVS